MILVAGASGTTGTAVLRELREHGAPVRALTHSPAKLDALKIAGAEAVVADLADPASLVRALQGVERLYVALPATQRLPQLEANLYAVAEQSGAYAVVKLGVLSQSPGAAMRIGRVHAEAFATLQATSLRSTLLQPAGFQQNYLRNPEVVASARGDARVAHVDARDVGAVAARVLTEDGHEGATYRLTGPEPLTDREIAGILGAEYREISDEQYAAALRAAGVPEWNVEALAELTAYYRSGAAAEVFPDVEALLGRPPTPFRELVAAVR